MMGDHSLNEPTELVIWATSGLLALVLGVGAAFALWLGLHAYPRAIVVDAAIGSLGIGVVLLAFAAERPVVRLFLAVLAVALVAGYLVGGPAFGRLVP